MTQFVTPELETETDFKAAILSAEELIGKAATTKLEYKTVHAIITQSKSAASAAIKTQEREYGNKYKLVRLNWEHPAVIAERNDTIAAAQK